MPGEVFVGCPGAWTTPACRAAPAGATVGAQPGRGASLGSPHPWLCLPGGHADAEI